MFCKFAKYLLYGMIDIRCATSALHRQTCISFKFHAENDKCNWLKPCRPRLAIVLYRVELKLISIGVPAE